MLGEDNLTNSGFIAIVGRPNVGKSTLLNALVGSKISIVTQKPQTTRNNILGIKTKENSQAIYIDTPGLHHFNGKKINKYMNKAVGDALQDVDVVVFVVEAMQFTAEDKTVLQKLTKVAAPVILAVNKIDQITEKEQLLPFINQITDQYDFTAVVPLSALKEDAVFRVETEIMKLLPKGPFYYPAKDITNTNIKFRIAEIVREQLMRELKQELPYAIAVDIVHMDATGLIHAAIWVERDSQKAIVIGKGGQTLKHIGIKARKALEKLLEKRVNLKLWVKVKPKWTDSNFALKEIGLTVDLA